MNDSPKGTTAMRNGAGPDLQMAAKSLRAAGISEEAIAEWLAAAPNGTGDYHGDRRRYAQFWKMSAALIGRLPPKVKRSHSEADAAQSLLAAARDKRERFLAAHCAALYDELTQQRSRFVRLEDLVFAAADAVAWPDADGGTGCRGGRTPAMRKGRRRDRSGHFSRPCARQR